MELPSIPYQYTDDGQYSPVVVKDIDNEDSIDIGDQAIDSRLYPSTNYKMPYDENGNSNNNIDNIYFDATVQFFSDNITTTTSAATTSASVLTNALYNTTMLSNNTNDTVMNNMVTRAELDQYLIFNIAYYMNRYYLWVIFALGFPGNIVSFVTILKMKPYTSPTLYIAGLALVDNTCIVCKLLFFLLTKYDVPLGHDGCGLLIFLGTFSAQLANWLLVAMTVERCLAICLPLKVGTICTKKVHIIGLALMVICLAAINAQNFVTNKMFDRNGDLSCYSNPAYQDFMKVWFWVDAIFYSFLPSALLIIMNTLLIMGIRRSAKIQREMTSKACHAAEGMRQQRQITIMLVIVCVVFVLLITPNALFYAIKPNWDFQKSAFETAKFRFTEQLIFVLCDSTHAVNFYLYFFSTRRFRTRCLETAFYCCGMSKRRKTRSYYYGMGGASRAGNGSSTCFRMSMTEVTSVPMVTGGGGGGGISRNGSNNNNAMPLRQYSSSSTSSASSMGRGGRHVIMRNGGGGSGGKKCNNGDSGGTKTTFKSKRSKTFDKNVECKKYELI